MANKISFKSIVLLGCSRRAGKNAHIAFACPYTEEIAKAMEWGEITERAPAATLEGELAAIALSIAPGDSSLKLHAFDLEQATVHKFQIVRTDIEGKRDKGKKTELRFQVSTADPEACAKVETYLAVIGQAKSKMTLSYAKQEVLFEATEEQAEATSEEND